MNSPLSTTASGRAAGPAWDRRGAEDSTSDNTTIPTRNCVIIPLRETVRGVCHA
jgi:hypothetical protein